MGRRRACGLLSEQKGGNPSFRHFEARQGIAIRVDRDLQVQGDGEVIGHTPVEIEVAPDAVWLVAPPPAGDD